MTRCATMDGTYMANHTHEVDVHGNISAHDGLDRCTCGSKDWDNDLCVICGRSIQRVWIENKGRATVHSAGMETRWTADLYRLHWGLARDFDEERDEPGSGRVVFLGNGYARIVVDA